MMKSKISAYDSSKKHRAIAVVFLLGAWMISCVGVDGSSCDSNDDCASGYYCRGPNQPNTCGIPPRALCASDADCSMGTVCHAIDDPCSADNIGSECKPACSVDSCGPNFRCNAGGACEPIPCDEGFTCPSYQKCDPAVAHGSAPIFDRSNGCVNIDCQGDNDCPAEKSCVTGFCQDGPGSCREDIAVP